MSVSSFKLKYLMFNFTDLPLRDFPSIFERDYQITVGVDIKTTGIPLDKDRFITLSIWDISLKERYNFIRTSFYKGSFGVIIFGIFDNPEIIQSVEELVLEINEKAPDIPYLVFNFDETSQLTNPFSLDEIDVSFKTIPHFDIKIIEDEIIKATRKKFL
ncbi:MAG: hypothetical protein ACTSRK_17650 [Promethearchaeota archaeon]